MKKTHIKKILAASIISLFFAQALYLIVVEPTIASATAGSAASTGTLVSLTVTSGVAITTPPTVTMSPISTSVNTSTNTTNSPSVVWNVKTNDAGGYALNVKTGTAAPALVSGGNSFADAGATPALWTSPTNATQFGFSVYGTDVTATQSTLFGTPASGCGVGILPDTTLKYRGFNGTTDIPLVTATGHVTPTAGVNTNICFAAEQAGVYAASGVYTVTVTATAVTT